MEKKGKFAVIAFSLIILNLSCSSNDLELSQDYPLEIINSWVESYEEDYGIYRPMDYKKFPESPYRQYYRFMENNACQYLMLSPVDAHYLENGFWEYIEEKKGIAIYDKNMELNRMLKVVSITSDFLQIEKASPNK
ncbi:MAG: hypothetical protein ACK5NB_01255 [Flavobacteriaceae bacterium]